MSRTDITCVILLLVGTVVIQAQPQARVFGVDDTMDVIDHRRFDSLWRTSMQRGLLNVDAAAGEVMATYLQALATASPDAFLPAARAAFWTNAHMAAVMTVMHRRPAMRSTIVDSSLFDRDTFVVAEARHTVRSLAAAVIASHGSVTACVLLGNGSSHAPPLLRGATFATTFERTLREQARRVFRSERFVLFDPGADALQVSSFFAPYLTLMEWERGSVVQFLLPWLDELTAAECALRRATLRVVVSDRIERWRRRR
ncbi:MAG: hypothetical protein FGM24_03340 [Candidatus Kapabacteria bacterium]|nr:hypothetical protein [Candidatus Kapabacteria bacterium]